MTVPDFFMRADSPEVRRHGALYDVAAPSADLHARAREPIFFASELPPRAHRYRAPATLQEYLSLFDDAPPRSARRRGLRLLSVVSHRAGSDRQVAPRARIVAILREPASFLRSLHCSACSRVTRPSATCVGRSALEEARRQGRSLPRRSRWPQVLLYSDYVRYVEQLRRYRALFAREQMLVLIYDDSVATTRRRCGGCCASSGWTTPPRSPRSGQPLGAGALSRGSTISSMRCRSGRGERAPSRRRW